MLYKLSEIVIIVVLPLQVFLTNLCIITGYSCQ